MHDQEILDTFKDSTVDPVHLNSLKSLQFSLDVKEGINLEDFDFEVNISK